MKILHTSDWHLGKTVMGYSMLLEQEYFIKEVFLKTVDETKPDAVIIAGDIFDRQIAPVEAISLFNFAISELCTKRKIKTFVIAGNHDSAQRLSVYKDLLGEVGFFISATPLDVEPIKVDCEDGDMFIHLLPYFEPATIRDILKNDELRGQNNCMKEILKEIKPIDGAKNILVSHCFAAGSETCDSESALTIGGSDEVDPSLFKGFDYVALGHLHGPQKVRNNGFYSGSPLKYSFDEEHQKKAMILVTFVGDEKTVRKIPIKPRKDMRTITGKINDIIEQGKKDKNNDDFIFADLLDERPIFEPMQKLREVYPNVLALRPGWLVCNLNGENKKLSENITRTSSDETIFKAFMADVCLSEPKEDEIEVFKEYMKKAGESK